MLPSAVLSNQTFHESEVDQYLQHHIAKERVWLTIRKVVLIYTCGKSLNTTGRRVLKLRAAKCFSIFWWHPYKNEGYPKKDILRHAFLITPGRVLTSLFHGNSHNIWPNIRITRFNALYNNKILYLQLNTNSK